MKLNFDGASRGNTGAARIGFILRKHSGDWILKRAKSLGIATNNIVELEAINEGLTFYNKLKIKKLIIEGDSQIILNALRNRSTPNWMINSKSESVRNF